MLNTVPFISKLMTLAKPFVKSEIVSLIKFLPGGLEDQIDLELLPEDLGGTLPSVDSFYKEVRNKLENEYREWLIASSVEKSPKKNVLLSESFDFF